MPSPRESIKNELVELQSQFEWIPGETPPIEKWDAIIDEILKDKPLINAGGIFLNHWDTFQTDIGTINVSKRIKIIDETVQHDLTLSIIRDKEDRTSTSSYTWGYTFGKLLVVTAPAATAERARIQSYDPPGTERFERKILPEDYETIELALAKVVEFKQ